MRSRWMGFVLAGMVWGGLSGCVDTNQNGQPDTVHPGAREAAGKTATAAVRYAGEATKNGAVEAGIRSRLSRDADVRPYRIDVSVNSGVATLKGEVNTAAEKSRAGALAKDQSGVSEVRNQIQVRKR